MYQSMGPGTVTVRNLEEIVRNNNYPFIILEEQGVFREYVKAWERCNIFGSICTVADRVNDVPDYLTKLGVAYLIQDLFMDYQTQAFVYMANLKKRPSIRIVDIYRDLRPRSIEWRVPNAQFALRLEDELRHGFDDNVVITEFAVPFGQTAWDEVMLN